MLVQLARLATIGCMKYTRVPFRLAVALVLAAGLIAGCGGGGDGQPNGPGAPAAPVFDVQAAIRAMFETPATYQLTGSIPAAAIGGAADEILHETDTFAPVAPPDLRIGDFPATVLTRTTWNSIDPVPRSASETYHYTDNPFRLVAIDSDGFPMVLTSTGDLPTSALPGQSGTVATGAGTLLVGWTVEAAEAPGTAWVCIFFGSVHSGGAGSQCVRVGANGVILGARVVVNSGFGAPAIDLRSPLPSQ